MSPYDFFLASRNSALNFDGNISSFENLQFAEVEDQVEIR